MEAIARLTLCHSPSTSAQYPVTKDIPLMITSCLLKSTQQLTLFEHYGWSLLVGAAAANSGTENVV